MRTQEFIQLRFPDEALPSFRGYDKFDNNFKKEVSFYDIAICNLKDDLRKLNIDYTQAANEILYLEKSKKNMLSTLKFKRDSLSEYLEDKEYINCDGIDMKIQNIREAQNSQKPQSQYNFEN